jgi:hypothetical protein
LGAGEHDAADVKRQSFFKVYSTYYFDIYCYSFVLEHHLGRFTFEKD